MGGVDKRVYILLGLTKGIDSKFKKLKRARAALFIVAALSSLLGRWPPKVPMSIQCHAPRAEGPASGGPSRIAKTVSARRREHDAPPRFVCLLLASGGPRAAANPIVASHAGG